jgi:uncharacterized membrane protein
MFDHLLSGLIFLAILGSGLMAGLFFVFSVIIMSALGRIPAPSGIAAMQSINKVIINPWFLVAFFGTAVACLALVIISVVEWRAPDSAYVIAGSVLYLTGSIVVTMVCNVPLNNVLAAADPGSAEGDRIWTRYLEVWTMWNHVRTVACLATTALLTLGFCARA